MPGPSLLPPLPGIILCEPVSAPDRLTIVILPSGDLSLRGQPERIREFLDRCAGRGLHVQLRFCSPCG